MGKAEKVTELMGHADEETRAVAMRHLSNGNVDGALDVLQQMQPSSPPPTVDHFQYIGACIPPPREPSSLAAPKGELPPQASSAEPWELSSSFAVEVTDSSNRKAARVFLLWRRRVKMKP